MPGVRLSSSPRREQVSWCDFRVPFLMLQHAGATHVSMASDLLPAVRRLIEPSQEDLDGRQVLAMQELVRAAHPTARCLWGHALYCEPERFEPVDRREIERLACDDPQAEGLREHFDGPIFVARASGGKIASWAAIKLKSDDVWEIAVTTEDEYRGRGLAKVVVSAATQHILESGRVPMYVHDHSNQPSAKVARALGYEEFGVEAYCSVSTTNPEGMW